MPELILTSSCNEVYCKHRLALWANNAEDLSSAVRFFDTLYYTHTHTNSKHWFMLDDSILQLYMYSRYILLTLRLVLKK